MVDVSLNTCTLLACFQQKYQKPVAMFDAWCCMLTAIHASHSMSNHISATHVVNSRNLFALMMDVTYKTPRKTYTFAANQYLLNI